MKIQEKQEYYIANENDTLVRDFGNNLQDAQEFLDNCPPEQCRSYRIVVKITTFKDVPRHV